MQIIRSAIKGLLKPLLDIRKTTNYDRAENTAKSIKEEVERLFTLQEKGKAEEFTAVMKRYQLTDEDIQMRQKGYFYMALFLIIAAFCVISYGVYLFTDAHWRGGIVSIGVAMAISGFAFRYHFWAFQLKNRKLGYTFGEWLRQAVLRRKQ